MLWVLSVQVRPMRLDREECNDLPHFFQRFFGFFNFEGWKAVRGCGRRDGRKTSSRPWRGRGGWQSRQKRPPKTARLPAPLPERGMTRTAVVLWLITPMATSSAIRAARVSASVSPGTAIIVQADRADGGHGLELGDCEVAGLDRAGQRGVLDDGHERAGEPTDAR